MLILELNFLISVRLLKKKFSLMNDAILNSIYYAYIFKYEIHSFTIYYVGVCVWVWDLSLDGFLQASSFILSNKLLLNENLLLSELPNY